MLDLDEEMDDASFEAWSFPSLRAQIRQLRVGESVAKCERVDYDTLSRQNLLQSVSNLRNNTQAALRRAARDTGHVYTVETGDFFTRKRDLIIAAVVTRIE